MKYRININFEDIPDSIISVRISKDVENVITEVLNRDYIYTTDMINFVDGYITGKVKKMG